VSASIEVGGNTEMMQHVTITDREVVVDYDVLMKTGIRSTRPAGIVGPGGDPTDLRLSRMSKANKKKYNYKRLVPRRYLDRDTRGHQVQVDGMTMKVWAWQDVPLYMEVSNQYMPEPIVMRALSVETDIELPLEVFIVPPDVTIVDEFFNHIPTPEDR
jgi:hypothetical protein